MPDGHKFKVSLFQPVGVDSHAFMKAVRREIRLLTKALPEGIIVKGYEERMVREQRTGSGRWLSARRQSIGVRTGWTLKGPVIHSLVPLLWCSSVCLSAVDGSSVLVVGVPPRPG